MSAKMIKRILILTLAYLLYFLAFQPLVSATILAWSGKLGLTLGYIQDSFSIGVWTLATVGVLVKFVGWLRGASLKSSFKPRDLLNTLNMRSVMWLCLGLACLMPMLPWSIMPIWNRYQYMNFIFIWQMFIEFALMALVVVELMWRLNISGRAWRWEYYFALDRLAIVYFTVAIYDTMQLNYSLYTLIGWLVAILCVTPLQCFAEEIQMRGLIQSGFLQWLGEGRPKLWQVTLVILLQAILFGAIHYGPFNVALWHLTIWMSIALFFHDMIFRDDALVGYQYLLFGGGVSAACVFIGSVSVSPISWPMLFGALAGQGVFGLAMGIITYMTNGVEYSSFWHALNNVAIFMSEFGVAFTPLHVVSAFSSQHLWSSAVQALIMVIVTACVYYGKRYFGQASIKLTENEDMASDAVSYINFDPRKTHPAAMSIRIQDPENPSCGVACLNTRSCKNSSCGSGWLAA